MNRFRSLAALVLLVAAVAVMLRNDQEYVALNAATNSIMLARLWPEPTRAAVGTLLRAQSDFVAGLSVLTVGLALARLGQPLVRTGRRWPGRGAAVLAVAGLAILYGAATIALEMVVEPASATGFGKNFLHHSIRNTARFPALAVLGAWTLLALARRWQGAETGLDRLGGWVGWAWLATIGFDLFQAMVW